MDTSLTPEEKDQLLRLAWAAVECAAQRLRPGPLHLEGLSTALTQLGSSFVGLYQRGSLRGCVGGLEARWPLAQDVCEHAWLAALHDYRFPPLEYEELMDLEIEVSVLCPAQALEYRGPDDLLAQLALARDGVILVHGPLRSTFLPQVWDQLAQPERFLSTLCEKMGLEANAWQRLTLEVYTYRVDRFSNCLPLEV